MSDREFQVAEIHKDDFARKMSIKDAYFSRGFDIERQRIAFYDRLILLAGGTLTLSFTAATTFESKNPNLVLLKGSDLTREAILFAISIVLALGFSWLTLSSLVHANRSITIDSSLAAGEFSHKIANSMLVSWSAEPVSEADNDAKRKADGWSRFTRIVAACCAVGSLAAFFAAYVFFFIFVSANLFRSSPTR